MARYEHLPIYRAAFDLAVHIEKIVHTSVAITSTRSAPSSREGSRRILERIIEANQSRDRGPVLQQLRRDLEGLRCWPACATSRRGSAARGRTYPSPSRWWVSRSRTRAGCDRRPARERHATARIDQGTTSFGRCEADHGGPAAPDRAAARGGLSRPSPVQPGEPLPRLPPLPPGQAAHAFATGFAPARREVSVSAPPAPRGAARLPPCRGRRIADCQGRRSRPAPASNLRARRGANGSSAARRRT